MPIGDSITVGANDVTGLYGGYRVVIQRLAGPTHKFTYVGTHHDNDGQPHDGYHGALIKDVADDAELWIDHCKPTVVLLQIGTNDMQCKRSPIGASNDLMSLVDHLSTEYPSTTFVVSTIPPVAPVNVSQTKEVNIDAYNQALRRKFASPPPNVRFVDIYQSAKLDRRSDFGSTGIHPTANGYEKIGRVWLAYLVANHLI